jgi:hypothetical protein
MDNFPEKRGYCKLKEDALERTLWRTRFGRDNGPAIRQNKVRIQGRCIHKYSEFNSATVKIFLRGV